MSKENKTEAKATFEPQSVRFSHELRRIVVVLGIKDDDKSDAASAIIGAMRRNIAERACKTLLVKGKIKEVKDHDDKQRATGTRLLKLRIGSADEWFLGLCEEGVQSLVRLDQAIAGLEKSGASAAWTPISGSAMDGFILDQVEAFKAREGYAALEAADTEYAAVKAAEEEAMLVGTK